MFCFTIFILYFVFSHFHTFNHFIPFTIILCILHLSHFLNSFLYFNLFSFPCSLILFFHHHSLLSLFILFILFFYVLLLAFFFSHFPKFIFSRISYPHIHFRSPPFHCHSLLFPPIPFTPSFPCLSTFIFQHLFTLSHVSSHLSSSLLHWPHISHSSYSPSSFSSLPGPPLFVPAATKAMRKGQCIPRS